MNEDLYDVIIVDATRRVVEFVAIEVGLEWARLEVEATVPKLDRGEVVMAVVSGSYNEGDLLRK